MRKIVVFALVVVALLAGVSAADPTGSDIVLTASGGRALTTGLGSPVGPSFIDIATDGSAWVKFLWFQDSMTGRAAADSAQIVRKLVLQVRDYTPPRPLFFPSGPDSLYVGFGTATEVIITR